MKIHIFIPKTDAVKGIVDPSNYSTWPLTEQSYVQVAITPDEFAKLEDNDIVDGVLPAHKRNELEERIYKESQSITGGEFSDWYNGLTEEEIEAYRKIYGH